MALHDCRLFIKYRIGIGRHVANSASQYTSCYFGMPNYGSLNVQLIIFNGFLLKAFYNENEKLIVL